MAELQNPNHHIALFKGKAIRKAIQKKEWWFSILDIIGVLTDSPQPKTYWAKMKERDEALAQPFPFWEQLKMPAEDGKMRETDCANTEGILRIIQSIPSPKAEPLKRWLAKVGYERMQEIENPELATKRTRLLYKLKGYPDNWIEKRMRGIAIREELTDEWQRRGAEHERDYEILTTEISKATFGITPSEYKKIKGLKRHNLRDHMDDFELILTMLGERTTTEIHRTKDSQGVSRLKDDARVGGQIAGTARKQIERKIGRSVVSSSNFLRHQDQKKMR
ncbi:MAG: Bro-N domain-containing protein [Candidatus Magasanikbacteria bacterium]|nr:Bro-N domain-containing protein [Candidatus Magasanikbacteria bacterium]